ncbi:MAG: 30S ribosomal protein THX [Bacteroidia bacterium]|nr:30S ribosomal protein THX [Bacteroidia bacterium]
MGKGDRKTEKGKRFKGSYGNSRPRKSTKAAVAKPAAKKAAPKKTEAKKKITKAKKAKKK